MPTVDFSAYPDGQPAGFTRRSSDGYLTVASGELRPAASFAAVDVVDWWWSQSSYDTPDTDNAQVLEIEVLFPSSGSNVRLLVLASSTLSSFNAIEFDGAGAWIATYESGGNGGSGSTSIPIASWFTAKLETTSSTAYTFSINGVTVSAGSFSNARTGLYAGLFLGSDARVRKLGFPTGISGGAPPVSVTPAAPRVWQRAMGLR